MRGWWVWALVATLAEGAGAQERVAVAGRLLDAGSGEPIGGATVELVGLGAQAVTDGEGAFRIAGVVPGEHELRVRHLAYGVHSETVRVPEGTGLALELRLSPRALELEPVDVEILRGKLSASTRSNVITRRQIEEIEPRARHVGDVVRAYIPSATVTETRGGYLCLEFRGARSSRTTGCNFPLIVVDDLPVYSPATFLRDLRVDDLERIEFIPASEAGGQYGMGATHGVLVIATRRSAISAAAEPLRPAGYLGYRWEDEPSGHPSARAFAGALVGSLGGTALGLVVLGCFPGSARSGAGCVEAKGVASGLSATALPLLGSVVGARLLGTTGRSSGRWLPMTVTGVLPAALGYAVYVEGSKSGFAGQRWLGGALVTVATPLVTTVADKFFRSLR